MVFYFLLLISNALFAAQLLDVELIANNKIVDDVRNCTQETLPDPLFYVSGSTNISGQPSYENFRTKKSRTSDVLGQLAVGSIIEVSPENDSQVGKDSYVEARVLQYSSQQAQLQDPLSGFAEGYIYGHSIESPELWDFQIAVSELKEALSEQEAHFLQGKVLRAHKSSEGYHVIECCQLGRCEQYPVFSVRETRTTEILTHLAFSPQHMDFIKQMTSVKVEDPSQQLVAPAISKRNDLAYGKDKGNGQLSIDEDAINSSVSMQSMSSIAKETVTEETNQTIINSSLRPPTRPEPKEQAQTFLASLFFPIHKAPIENFTEGMRRFGASRSGGQRKHAGCDLYHPLGEKVRAVKGGTVLRRYHFYLGSYAVEVKNNDGTIIRYGELSGRSAEGAGVGKKISAGDTVGYIGKLTGMTKTMLHFEEFRGTVSGALTQAKNLPYKRRKDLQDPTPLLVSLGKKEGILR